MIRRVRLPACSHVAARRLGVAVVAIIYGGDLR